MACIICENQVSKHYSAANGTMIVQLCKEHRNHYEDLTDEIIPVNPTCPACSHFGRCCKTRGK